MFYVGHLSVTGGVIYSLLGQITVSGSREDVVWSFPYIIGIVWVVHV